MELLDRYATIIALIINLFIFTKWPSDPSTPEILKYVAYHILGSVIIVYYVISGWHAWVQAWRLWTDGIIFEVLTFRIYSRYWKFSEPEYKLAVEELERQSELCGTCRKMVLRSSLLCGSRWRIARLVEWHDHHGTFEDISTSAHHCHLCAMVLSSIKRQDILTQGQAHPSPTATANTPLLSSRVSAHRIRFKIWEQRPLTKYTYLRLFCKGKPISDRFHITRMANQRIGPGDTRSRDPAGSKAYASLANWLERGNKSIGPEDTRSKDTTSSNAHVSLAKFWIERCNEWHNCRRVDESTNKLPKRLVEIGGFENGESSENLVLRLIESATLSSSVLYVAISYCWGGFEDYKLMSTNYSDSLRSIPVHRVPQTLRHALFFAYRMGIPYVWIDSMCIVQGDAKDSAEEIAQMHNIYANAYVTIAGSCSSSSDQPLYRTRDPRSLQPCPILGKYMIRDELADFENSVDLSPLSKRGWVFQERLLSPRTLHFGPEMLYWECSRRSASEIYRDGFTYRSFDVEYDEYKSMMIEQRRQEEAAGTERPPRPGGFLPEYLGPLFDFNNYHDEIGIRNQQREEVNSQQPAIGDSQSISAHSLNKLHKPQTRLYEQRPWWTDLDTTITVASGFKSALDSLRYKRFSKNITKPNGFHRQWYELVSIYSLGQLTQPDDKMSAFNGITQTVATATGFFPVFGMWDNYLQMNILWYAPEGGQRPPRIRAPTWSWLSLDGPISQGLMSAEINSPQSFGSDQGKVLNTILLPWKEGTTDTWLTDPRTAILVLRAKTCEVVRLVNFNGALFLVAGWSRYIGRFYADVADENFDDRVDLLCVKVLSLKPYSSNGDGDEDEQKQDGQVDTQGLVVAPLSTSRGFDGELNYQRVGYFTTKPFHGIDFSQDLFTGSQYKKISLR